MKFRAVAILILLAGCSATEGKKAMTLDGKPPIIIAHRGLSGEFPEHTEAAYMAAIRRGADFIEPDLVLSKDGVLVARHENEISEATNVSQHPEFANRKTVKTIDGKKIVGWFTEDFTLAELKTLRARERIPQLRKTEYDGMYPILTFDEILNLVAVVNRERKHPIGVYPETKHPTYFASIGLSHERPLLAALDRHSYKGRKAAVFIQSFEIDNLKALRAKTDLPLIQLMDESGSPADQPGMTYAQMATSAGLKAIATYADGIGPNKSMIIPRNMIGKLGKPTALVADAHKAGLAVHPWTFRRENYFLPLDNRSGLLPATHGDLIGEIRTFLATGIDGFFTDNTPEAAKALKDK